MSTESKIKEYFKNGTLEVLDQTSTNKVTFLGGDRYEAVTVRYIHEYVLKKRVTLKYVYKIIAKLLSTNYLGVVPCVYAGDVVICSKSYLDKRSVVKFKFDTESYKVVFGNNPYYESSQTWSSRVATFNNYL